MSKLSTTPEAPVQVRRLNQMVKDWIEQLGQIWVEGEIAHFVHPRLGHDELEAHVEAVVSDVARHAS